MSQPSKRDSTIDKLRYAAHKSNWDQAKVVYADEIEAYARQQKLELLERLKAKAGWYCEVGHKGLEDTLVPLSALEAELTKLKKEEK